MKDELITRITAKLAKEKGFDIPTNHMYIDANELIFSAREEGDDDYNWNSRAGYSVPTQSLLQRWLREEHGIYIELIIDGWDNDNKVSEKNLGYRAFIWEVEKPKPKPHEDLGMCDFEIILEIALYEALKQIK